MNSGPSIRSQIRTMALGVALPLILLAGFAIWTDFRNELRLAELEADAVAAATAVAARSILSHAEDAAEELLALPQVRALDAEVCRTTFAPIASATPSFPNIVLTSRDGDFVCSAVPPVPGAETNAADRGWFTRAMATGRPQISPPVQGRLLGEWVVAVTYPITDDSGEVVGGLTIPMALDRFQPLVQADLPYEALMTITDTGNVVLARSVDPEEWVGRSLPAPENPEEFADLSADRGLNLTSSAEGDETLFAYRRVPDSPWIVWVGTSTDEIYAPARRALYPKLGLVLIGLLIAGLTTERVSSRIRSSLERVGRDMEAAEDDSERTVDETGPAEVSNLARLYNRLLAARRGALREATRAADVHGLVLRATRDAVWDWDLEADHLEGNPRFEELFGGAPTPIPGHARDFWRSRIHPDDVDEALATKLEQPKEGANVWAHEYRIRGTGPDDWVVVLDRGRALRDDSGRPVRLVGSIMDVTEERRKQQEIRRAKERYESILENATFGIYVAAEDGRVIDSNSALRKMTGWEENDAPLNERDFFEDVEDWERQLAEAVESGEPTQTEVYWVGADGRRLRVRLFRAVLREAGGEVATEVIAEDLTDQRELELQFRQAQKMEAMGRLAGGVAHDFNNRLTVIRGRAQLLREDLEGEPDHLASVDAIIDSANRAASLTAELLAVSRKQIFRPQVVDLNDIVGRMRPMFDTLLGNALTVRTDFEETAPPIVADPGQVEQILVNLIVNARDAMPSGGEIVVATRERIVQPAEDRRTPGLEAGHYVALTVVDQGVGMVSEVLERVFEPFFTTKPLGEGTGLGLATVYGLVKVNGGWIGLDSEPGVGTRVEVLLPLANANPETEEPARPREVPKGHGARILVVEDEPAVRDVVRRSLSRLGYQVVTADSAAEALAFLEGEPNRFDLIVTDVVMPGMSGIDMAEIVRNSHPDMPILFMSGYTDQSASLLAGLDDERQFLGKPFTPQALGLKVAAVLVPPDPEAQPG